MSEKGSADTIHIIGGAMAGLLSGLLIHHKGIPVAIHERGRELPLRPGDPVYIQPEIKRALGILGHELIQDIVVTSRRRVVLDDSGSVRRSHPMHLELTSHSAFVRYLHACFPSSRYHNDRDATGCDNLPHQGRVHFADGTSAVGPLIIAADGADSLLRSCIFPEAEDVYTGYCAFCGLVDETDIGPELNHLFSQSYVYHELPNASFILFMLPGKNDSARPGQRRYRWQWYVNVDQEHLPVLLTDSGGHRRKSRVPCGQAGKQVVQAVCSLAADWLPAPLATLVNQTEHFGLFTVRDIVLDRLFSNRFAFIGDAGIMPRSHTAANAAKAASDAMDLADALEKCNMDVPAALAAWEPARLEVSFRLRTQGRALGRQTQNRVVADSPVVKL